MDGIKTAQLKLGLSLEIATQAEKPVVSNSGLLDTNVGGSWNTVRAHGPNLNC
jgi:hypothetical protein